MEPKETDMEPVEFKPFSIPITQKLVEDQMLPVKSNVLCTEDRYIQYPGGALTKGKRVLVFKKGGKYKVVRLWPEYPGGFVVTTELSKGFFTGKKKKNKNTALIHFGSEQGGGQLFRRILTTEEEYDQYKWYVAKLKELQGDQEQEEQNPSTDQNQKLVIQVALDIAHYMLYFVGAGGEATRKELMGIAWKRTQSLPIIGESLKLLGNSKAYYFDTKGKFVASQVHLEQFIGQYSGNSNYEGPRLDYPGVDSSLSLKFSMEDDGIADTLENTLWDKYDTIILDLDGTIWDVVSEKGESLSASDIVPPLVLMDKDIILDSKNNTIRLQLYVRELLEALDRQMKNLGITSRAELLNRPFESQPAIMALKKFDLYGYFNYEIILKKNMDKEEYIKPLGETLFIDNERETIKSVDIGCCADVMWRGSFQQWSDTMLPRKENTV